jgi:recombinational DNA repair protein (RecF pathway)
MKGFILSINKAKNEDIIVTVLTSKDIRSYYRFFGARHSILQLGYMIDFEVDESNSNFLPRIKSISQQPFSWLFDKNRLLLWQNFITRVYLHLKDTSSLDDFYYQLLLKSAIKWQKQNPKRVLCDSYIELLDYEGRLYKDDICFICQSPLEEDVSLMSSYKLAHPRCIYGSTISKAKLLEALRERNTINLDDEEIEYLYLVAQKSF